MAIVYRSVKGVNLTPTEVDDNFEWLSKAGEKAKGTSLTFDRPLTIHATALDPETTQLTISEIGAIPGCSVMFYWSGSSNPTFTGQSGTITSYSTISIAGTYECWLIYKGGGNYSLNIPQASGGAADITAPTLLSATIEDAAPQNIVMVFDESVTMTDLVDNGFTLNGTTSTVFTSISGSGTTWTGVLGTAAANGETITISYSSVTGDVVDGSSNALATFSGTAVTNNIDAAFDADYQAVLDRGTALAYTLPSAGQQVIQNQLVIDMKSNGMWAAEDVIYVPANDGSEEFGRLNWKSPTTFELSKIGTVAWTSNLGFKGDGTTGAMNTGWDRATNGVNFALEDASYSIYVSSAPTVTPAMYAGGRVSNAVNQFHIYRNNTTGNFRSNGSAQLTLPAFFFNTLGFYSIVRWDDTVNNSHFYLNGAVNTAGNLASISPLGAIDIYIGALNDNGVINQTSDIEWGFWSIGSAQYALQASKSTLISNYMAAIVA